MLEKNIKRNLDMITQVYYQRNHKMDKDKLQSSLGITTKTLVSDIEKVNMILKKEVIIQENGQITLNLRKNEGLKQIYKTIIKTSTIVSYFYEVSMYHLTLPEIYNDLYLSESMEYRIRKAWNLHFESKNYPAEFVYNPVTKKIDLVGDEDTIRSLMRYMLFEYVYEDIYDDLKYNEIVSWIEIILDKKKKKMSFVAIDLMAASLYISFTRISQGYKREMGMHSSLKSLQKWLLKEPQIMNSIRYHFDIEISAPVLSDLFGGKFLELMNLVGFNSKRVLTKQNKKLLSFVSAYSKMKYHNEVHLKKSELQLLKGICDFSDFRVSSFIYSPHKLYWDWNVTKNNKKLYYELINYYDMEPELPTEEKKVEFFFVLNNMLQFDNLEKSVNHTKVLIVSRYPTYYQNRIEKTLNDRYHEFIKLTIYKGSIIDLDEHDIQNYECIISEFTAPMFSDKQVYFPEILSEEFIRNLDNVIFHV